MAAGEIWIDAVEGTFLRFRDYLDRETYIRGTAISTPVPAGRVGEVWVSPDFSALWWVGRRSNDGAFVEVRKDIAGQSITGSFVPGELFVQGIDLYVAVTNNRANRLK